MNAQKIALLVDSCTDVPADFISRYNMYVVPLKVIYKDKEYTDGVDITAEDIYARLPIEIPTTSLPGAHEITATLNQIKADGYEKVLAITISSGLSGTFNLIRLIAKEYEGLDIFVVDTKNIGIGSGFAAIEAVKHLDSGMGWEELTQTISNHIVNTKVFFCVSTLEYLTKGGRIGLVSSIAGNLLNLKPIISCNEEGVYYTVAKVRGRHQSLQKTIDLASEFAKTGKHYNIALVHGNAQEEADSLKELLLSKLPNCNICIEGQISPALGVHTGPGLIGIGIQLITD